MSLESWIITAVAGAILGTLSFLMKGTFNRLESSLSSINTKLDALKAEVSSVDKNQSVADVEVNALKKRVEFVEGLYTSLISHLGGASK